jgi:hypothetical protein
MDQIVARYVVQEELRSIDRDAPTNSTDGEAIETDKQEAARREADHAERLAPAFEDGLLQAWQRFTKGGHELVLDDRRTSENLVADALIQLLVRFDLATSRTEETDPMHYRYYISIDWPQLRGFAASAGFDLDGVLGRAVNRIER